MLQRGYQPVLQLRRTSEASARLQRPGHAAIGPDMHAHCKWASAGSSCRANLHECMATSPCHSTRSDVASVTCTSNAHTAAAHSPSCQI